MLESYINLVTTYPILTAAIQFAILGTLGEFISHYLVQGDLRSFCTNLELAGKIIGWGLMGVLVKYGFMGMTGFTDALLAGGKLPSWSAYGLGYAFTLSVLMQAFFGPQLMFFHRLEDNLIMRQWNFAGMSKALWALVWFWLPAHTITFALEKPFQIGLAALWSVALGLILGLAKSKGRLTQQSPA